MRPSRKSLASIGLFLLDASTTRCLTPIVSNRILIKNGEVKVLGDSFSTNWSEITEDFYTDNVASTDDADKPQITEVYDRKDSLRPSESDMADLDYLFGSETSSDIELNEEPEHQDPSTLPETLKLLEEIHYRILGDKTVTIPKIENVEIIPSKVFQGEEEESSEETSSKEEEVDEEESVEDINEFLDTVQYSELFVDNILRGVKQVHRYKHGKDLDLSNQSKCKSRNISWPAIGHFSVGVGVESIDKYIHYTFELTEAWKYKICYLIAQSDKVSDFYLYEAKFCIPTPTYPIAQATVSLFFNFEVSRVIPDDLPVRVTFTLESLRRVMVPGDITVNDEMLLRVLYSKLAVFKELHF